MSILIKGMEMPISCGFCLFEKHTDDGYECCINGCLTEYQKRPSDCPLIYPAARGNLIGREWLIDIALHLMNTAKNDDIANGVKWLLQYIIDAPIIIPAEGESEA